MQKQLKLPIHKSSIEEAHALIKPFIEQTPVLKSTSINALAGCEIYFKCENFQKIGAFKMRGATYALLQIKANGKGKKVVTHSSGNHAQAVAKAARALDMEAFIVMPRTAPKIKVEGVKALGGKITFCEPNLKAREENMQQIKAREGAIFVPPYDDLDVITGQASAAKELIKEVPNLNTILAPVGGGGLLAGSALAAYYYANNCKVFGAEPEGADDAYRSFKAGELIPQNNPNTIADGLLTSLGDNNFKLILQLVEAILLTSDQEIVKAMRLIWERLKIIVEPSCAVPLAAVLKNKPLFKDQKIGIILSGGNVDLDHYFEKMRPLS